MARAECAGFELREEKNRCSFWKSGPLAPKVAKGVHCYKKESRADVACSSREWQGLVPVAKGKSTAEVVVPATGRASMRATDASDAFAF